MHLLGKQDALELHAIVEAVPSDPSQRIDPKQLAAKVGLPVGRVEYLLEQHPRYFVNVGGKNLYSLNRFSADHGSRSRIAAEIEASLRESARASRLAALTPFACLAVAHGPVIFFLLGRQQWAAALLVSLLPSFALMGIGIREVTRRHRTD